MQTLALIFLVASQGLSAIYDIELTTIENKKTTMKDFESKVVLVVNTASKCGFTSQYEGLQEIYTKYKDRGFVVLGFPSNDFMGQEPGTSEEIVSFCKSRFGVSFPLFQKAPVKGEGIQPLYEYLTKKSPEEFRGEVGWNFVKFLIDRKGQVVGRFSSIKKPTSSDLTKAIERALK